MVKKYSQRVSFLKERVCLLAYPEKKYGTELAEAIYGSPYKSTQLYGRVLKELVKEGYLIDLGRGEGYLTTPKLFVEEIKKHIDITPEQEKQIYEFLDGPTFRGILGTGDFYAWIERYRMHPLNIFFNLLGIHALAGIEIKPYLHVKKEAIKIAKKRWKNRSQHLIIEKVPEFSKLPNDVLEIFMETMDPFLRDVLVGAVSGVKKSLSGVRNFRSRRLLVKKG